MSAIDQIQFDSLLAQMTEQGASDLYLFVGSSPTIKVANRLVSISSDILTAVKIEELIYPLLATEQKELLTKEKSLIFSHTSTNGLRFKVNLYYQKGALSVSLHLIPATIKSIRELGLPEQVEQLARLREGLLIITGPVGAGKTTTSAALIEGLNLQEQLTIVTIEQPIEYLFINKQSIIQQREVGRDTPSFVKALTDCLEASLDVVLVGQLESAEEIEKVLELAVKGYLIIALSSANSVTDALAKILDNFEGAERMRIQGILSRVLKGIICQKLLPAKDGSLVLVPEILTYTEAVRLSLQDNKLNQINNIIRTSAQQGMVSFEQSLARLTKEGVIDQMTALNYAENKDLFKQMLVE